MDPITALANLAGQGLNFGGLFVQRGNIRESKLPVYTNPQLAKNQENLIIIAGFLILAVVLAFVFLKKK